MDLRWWVAVFCIITLLFSCGTNSKVYSWNFKLAPVFIPLLGRISCITSTIKGQKVVHADCPESVILWASPEPVPAFCSVAFLSAPQYRSSWKIFLIFYSWTVSLPQNLALECNTIFSPTAILQFLPNHGGWIRRSYLLPRRNSPPWRKQELSDTLPSRGPLLSPWLRRRMEAGGPAEIAGVWTKLLFLTGTLYLILLISLLG